MAKKVKITEKIAADMEAAANNLTAESIELIDDQISTEWAEHCRKFHLMKFRPYDCNEYEYHESRIFADVKVFLKNRTDDMLQGCYREAYNAPTDELMHILAYSFEGEYTFYSWDESSTDPDNSNSFYETEESYEGNLKMFQTEVFDALKEFVTAGAVQAKKVGSAAYEQWAALLIDLTFHPNAFFFNTDKIQHAYDIWDRISAAAMRTHVDSHVFEVMSKKSAPKRAMKK